MMTSFDFPPRSCLRQDLYPRVNLPDFMTRARREFIDSAVFFDFLGGMAVMKEWDVNVGGGVVDPGWWRFRYYSFSGVVVRGEE